MNSLARKIDRRHFLRSTALSFGAASTAGMAATHLGLLPSNTHPLGVLPGEFEYHEAMLFGTFKGNRNKGQKAIIASIIEAAETTDCIVIVRRPQDEALLRSMIVPHVPDNSVEFVHRNLKMLWVRDFAPFVVKSGNPSYTAVDYQYTVNPEDSSLPEFLARKYSFPIERAPIHLHGGNLLSNGAGCGLTTNRLLAWNEEQGWSKSDLQNIAKRYFGIEELVILDPLVGEQTGHIDMFATFLSANTVAIGKYAPGIDDVNAEVLDQCADQLSRVVTRSGPMNVVRVPMPKRVNDKWYTYTNVVYANGKMLVPVYQNADAHEREQTLDQYRQLMPGWKIVPIDCTDLIFGNGVLHCVTANIASRKASI